MNALTLLKVESIKITRRRPIVYFTLAIVAVTLISLLPDYFLARRDHVQQHVVFPQIWSLVARGPAGGMVAFLAAIVIAMIVASEFMWRTSRQNVIDGLSKNEWFTAKLLMSLVMCVVFTGLIFGTATVVGFLSPFDDFVRLQDVRMFGLFLLSLIALGSLAFWLSMVLRKDGPALGIFLIWQSLELLLAFALEKAHKGWGEALKYMPMNVFHSNLDPRYWDPAAATNAIDIARRNPLRADHPLGLGLNVGLTLAYVLLFVGGAYWSYRRRDL